MAVAVADPLAHAVEVLKDTLYFAPGLRRPPEQQRSAAAAAAKPRVYEPFFADFGPLNFGHDASTTHKRVVHYTSSDPHKIANAAVLVGCFLVLERDLPPRVAYEPLSRFAPYAPFRDPGVGQSGFDLTVLHCLEAVQRAKSAGWLNLKTFNAQEYEFYEQVENGDLNWIVPKKLLAFSGPSARRAEFYGYRSLVPEDYIQYFKQSGVCAVVRLNKRVYDRRRFADHGLRHYDLYFPDGRQDTTCMHPNTCGAFTFCVQHTCPSESLLRRFLELAESETGALAVHCKHYGFTATEAIGYLRIMRPGMVIGPQQQFLQSMQEIMRAEVLHTHTRTHARDKYVLAG
eukprot:jgi/Chlat1/8320/Chrsp8S09242